MYSQVMTNRTLTVPFALTMASTFALSVLIGCGGKQVPEHDGYRTRWKPGWERPKKLEFDEDFEAEKDGELSYPKRKRVRWYQLETPEDGELEIVLQAGPLGSDPDEEEDDEDVDDPFDVGFELYDRNYKMLLRADNEEDDAGDRQKSRTAYQLPQGKYLLHLYLQRRIDEAEFTVTVKFKSGSVEPQTDFPKNVAYVDLLPVVPAVDDSPLNARPPRRKCRGKRCKKPRRPRKPRDPKPDDKPEPVVEGALKGKITVIRAQASGGTEIVINKGSNNGVTRGWKGKLVTRKGKAIPGGRFTVRSVKTTSCKAKINVTSDAVKQAGRVVLTAP